MSQEIVTPNTIESVTSEQVSTEYLPENALEDSINSETLSNEEIDKILGLDESLIEDSFHGETDEEDISINKKKKIYKKKSSSRRLPNTNPDEVIPIWEQNNSSFEKTWEDSTLPLVQDSDLPPASNRQWDINELAPKESIPIYELGGEAFVPGNLDDLLMLNVNQSQDRIQEKTSEPNTVDYDGFIKTHILAVKDSTILTNEVEMTAVEPTDTVFSSKEKKEIPNYFKDIDSVSIEDDRAKIIEAGIIKMKADLLSAISNEKKGNDNNNNSSNLSESSVVDIHNIKSFEHFISNLKAQLEDSIVDAEEKIALINSFVSGIISKSSLSDEEKIYIRSRVSEEAKEDLEAKKNVLGEFGNCQKKYEELKVKSGFDFNSVEFQDLVSKMASLQFNKVKVASVKNDPVRDYFHIKEKSVDFIRKTGIKLESLFESSGSTFLEYTKEKAMSDQGLAMDGLREIIYKASLYGQVLTGDLLEKASLKNHVASTSKKFATISEDAKKCSLLMSAEGKSLSIENFKDIGSLKKALGDSNLNSLEKKRILANRKTLEMELRAEQALKSVSNIDDFYSLKNVSKYNKAVQDYLRLNVKGKNIRVNANNFSKSDLKKLEKIASGKDSGTTKIGGKTFTKEEASMLLSVKRRNDLLKAKRALRNHKTSRKSIALFRLSSRFIDKSSENNDTLAISFRNTRKIKRISSVMVGIVAASSKFILKKTKLINKIELGKSFVRTKINNVTTKATNIAISTTVKGIKLTKKTLTSVSHRINRTKPLQTINKAVTRFGDTSLGKFGNKVAGNIKKTAIIIKKRKPVQKIKNATKVTGRILSSPGKLLTKIFDKINIFRKWVAIILGVIFLIYLTLLAIFFAWFGLLSAFGTDSVTGDHNTFFSEVFNSYIVYHKDNKMKSDVAWINDKASDVVERATEIGEGYPFNDEVFESHHIDKYGSPDKDKGYIINYYNANGLLLPNSSSNTKDVMAIAVTVAGNYIGTDDLDEVDNSEYFKMDRLIKDVYEQMIYHDPDTNLPFSYEESEIYVCNHGCDDYYYFCNGALGLDGMDDYNRYLQYKSDGVGFYESDIEAKITKHLYDNNSRYTETIKMFGEATWDNYVRVNSVTGKGCRRRVTSFSKPIYRLSDTDEIATYDTEAYDAHYADSIDDWLNGYYYYEDENLYFMPPQLYRDYITCYDVEYYCNGDHLTKCCYGHKDIELKVTLYDVEYIIREGIYPDGVDGGALYTDMCHKFREDGYWSCEGSCNMARNFKLGDWFDIYDILIEGAEFSTTPTLTYAQKQEILSAYDGDIEALRRDIIAYGLDYVGKITYEYGGKASCFGPNATFGTTTGDSKGRTRGLDCSGFLNYIIGSASGINVPIGTAHYASYPRKSEGNLQVGDLGFIKRPGADGNHVAMYIGRNSNGQRMWLECNSSQGACVTTSTAYKYFLDPLAVSH